MTLFSLYTENLREQGTLNDLSLKCAPKFKTHPLRKHVSLTSQKISVKITVNCNSSEAVL